MKLFLYRKRPSNEHFLTKKDKFPKIFKKLALRTSIVLYLDLSINRKKLWKILEKFFKVGYDKFLQLDTLEEAVQCGHWSAREMIKVRGCSPPQHCGYESWLKGVTDVPFRRNG